MYNKIIDYLLSLDIGQRFLCFDLSLCQNLEIDIVPFSELYLKYGILKIYFNNIKSYDLYVEIKFLNVIDKFKYCKNVYVVSNESKKNNVYRFPDIINTIFQIDLSDINFYLIEEAIFYSCKSFISFINNNGHIKANSVYISDGYIFDTENKDMLSENTELLKISLFNLLNMNIKNDYKITEHVVCLYIFYYEGEEVSLNDYRVLFDDINIYLLTHLNKYIIEYVSKHKVTVYIDKYCVNKEKNMTKPYKDEKVKSLLTNQLFCEFHG